MEIEMKLLKLFVCGIGAGMFFGAGALTLYFWFFDGIIETATAAGPLQGVQGILKLSLATPLAIVCAIFGTKLLAWADVKTAKSAIRGLRGLA
jgi:hypothetical protein